MRRSFFKSLAVLSLMVVIYFITFFLIMVYGFSGSEKSLIELINTPVMELGFIPVLKASRNFIFLLIGISIFFSVVGNVKKMIFYFNSIDAFIHKIKEPSTLEKIKKKKTTIVLSLGIIIICFFLYSWQAQLIFSERENNSYSIKTFIPFISIVIFLFGVIILDSMIYKKKSKK